MGAVALSGCGGGGGHTTTAPTAATSTASKSASLTLSLTWPSAKDATATGRAFPIAANSLKLTITDSAGYTETQTLVRPPATSANQTVTATFFALTPGPTTITASAYASTDGTGTVLSDAARTVTLQIGAQTGVTLDFPSPVTSIALTPATSDISRGSTKQLTATATDDRGNTFTPVGTWSSSAPGVATVDANGNVSGVGLGSATITFTSTSFSFTASATVNVRGITGITLAPSSLLLLPGATGTFTAAASDSFGAVQTNPPGSWASSDTNIATVNANGTVTAVRTGTATITFTDSVFGVTGQGAVTVRGITNIAFSPDSPTIAPGGSVTLSVTGEDRFGVVQANPPGTWSSSDSAIATVDTSGKVTGIKGGIATITFKDSVYGATDSTEVTVRGGDAEVIVK